MKIGMIETCSKSESTNAVINNKLERHKGLPVQQVRVSLIFSVWWYNSRFIIGHNSFFDFVTLKYKCIYKRKEKKNNVLKSYLSAI